MQESYSCKSAVRVIPVRVIAVRVIPVRVIAVRVIAVEELWLLEMTSCVYIFSIQ